jgi:hypothetical protein
MASQPNASAMTANTAPAIPPGMTQEKLKEIYQVISTRLIHDSRC